ncbi:MAG: hypothetical protein ACRCTJ_07105 [Brevinema sp.]
MIKYLSYVMLFLGIHNHLFSQFNPNSFQQYITNTHTSNNNDVIHELPEYHSYINWTKGQLIAESQFPVTYTDPNIGRNVTTLSQALKTQLIDFIFSALKKVQVSSIFFVEDYFKRDKQVEIKILSMLLSLNIQNNSMKDSYVRGQMVFPLYGSNSLSEPFFRNIKTLSVTNYLQKEIVSSVFFDTLIIDMVMFEKFNPSLMTKITDQNRTVLHSIETINNAVLLKQGPVHFVSSLKEAFRHPSRGKNVAYILPENISGVFSSDIVLFNNDAKKIFSQQRTINALRNGNVIVVVSADRKK